MGTREEIMQRLQARFRDDIAEVALRSAKRVYISIAPQALTRVATYLFAELGARFNTASAMDMGNRLEILYHFTIDSLNLVISARVVLARDGANVDSLVPVFPAANWIEREINEMLGVEFRGHPELRRLLLSDEWPNGAHPLRRDYIEWDPKAVRDRGAP